MLAVGAEVGEPSRTPGDEALPEEDSAERCALQGVIRAVWCPNFCSRTDSRQVSSHDLGPGARLPEQGRAVPLASAPPLPRPRPGLGEKSCGFGMKAKESSCLPRTRFQSEHSWGQGCSQWGG